MEATSAELARSVEDTLRGMLGESPAETLLYYLDLSGKDRSPKALSGRLHKLLGSGALVVEHIIAKSLYQAFGETFEDAQKFDFAEAVGKLDAIIGSRGNVALKR